MDWRTEDQITFEDLGLWYGKTSQVRSAQTVEKTSEPSSKKRRELQIKTPLFLDLRKGSKGIGLFQDVLWETTGRSLGEYMMPNFGGFRKDEGECVFSLTSTGTPQENYYLNCGEKPLEPRPTKLSQILEQNPDPKYNLSPKACQGILNRAQKRGKELPKMLQDALEHQAQSGNSSAIDTSSDLSDEDG